MKAKLCCLMHGKGCAWCPNYFGCCNDPELEVVEGNRLCQTCWGKYIRVSGGRELSYGEHVKILKPLYEK